MSAFEIGASTFYRARASAQELGGRLMETKVHRVLDEGTAFFHEYDFGSTTRLRGTTVSIHPGTTTREPLRVLALNEPPEPTCSSCGDDPAAHVCSFCLHGNQALLCDACARDHPCEEVALLPLVNSPRTGVCGYTGPREQARERRRGGWVKE